MLKQLLILFINYLNLIKNLNCLDLNVKNNYSFLINYYTFK